MPMRFVHTNIAAQDWNKLAQFYINVFGCTIKPPERRLSGEWLDKGTGLRDAKLEGVHLRLPGFDNNGPTLEIFTYSEMKTSDEVTANKTGFTHIAFEVDDVATTLELALNNGATKLGEITGKHIEGAGDLTFVYFRDPEGNIVEIQSWDK